MKMNFVQRFVCPLLGIFLAIYAIKFWVWGPNPGVQPDVHNWGIVLFAVGAVAYFLITLAGWREWRRLRRVVDGK